MSGATKRAIVFGPGGLRGAYSAGVGGELGLRLGPEYFSAVYCCSAGAYTAPYFVSGQYSTVERFWRECVHGAQVIKWRNLFTFGRPVLDLAYLDRTFREGEYRLNVEAVLGSAAKLTIVATELHTGRARYLSPQTADELFLQVQASAAAPYLHRSVSLNGQHYIDGHLSDPFPVAKALVDGCDEVVVVCNSPRSAPLCPAGFDPGQVKVISPSRPSPLRWALDRSERRIGDLIELGIADAQTFVNGLG